MNLKKEANESDLQYIWRLSLAKDSGILDMTWEDLTKIFNENLESSCCSDVYRKKFNQAQNFYNEVFSKQTSDEQSKLLMEQKRELERLKIQYRDERNAWNRQNYIDARIEQKFDYLSEQLKDIGKINFNIKSNPITIKSDNDLIVCLADLHIGETFNSWFGEYNTDIAKRRLNEYIEEIIKIGKRHNSENVYVTCLGDIISGNIHLSIQVSNRENIIDQIKLSAEFITSFCVELSKHFKNIYLTGVAGNHSRLVTNKEKDIKDERLDSLIIWIIEQITNNINNIKVIDNEIDSGICSLNVRGNKYISVHGDYDNMSDAGISKLVMAIGDFPYAILGGHKHSPAYKEFNNVKYIQSGSLVSTGDDYTISKRLVGKPSQTVLVCNKKGIECLYNVELK